MIDLNSIQLNNTVSSTKVNNSSKTSKDTSNDFSTLLKTSSDNSTVKNKDTSVDKVKNETLKDNDGDKTSVDKNLSDKKVELNEKVKGELKKAGFSEEDIENLEKDLSQGNISQNALMYLINILFKSENNSTDNLNLQGNNDEFIEQISNKISSEILQNLNYITAGNKEQNTIFTSDDMISKVIKENVNDLSDILEQFGTSQEFNNKLIEKLNTSILAKLSSEESIYDKVKSEINTALSKELNLSNPQEETIDNLSELKIQNQYNSNKIDVNKATLATSPQEISSDNIENNNSSNSSEKNGQSSTGNGAKNEENILQKIIEGGSEDKISKVTNFMTYFKNMDTNNPIQDLGEMAINKNSFNSDMIKTLKYMDINNVKELTVKINPKELGEITINLTMQEGKLKAVLTASNKEAYNLLNANLQDLSNKIQTNDIKVQGLSLNIYNEDATFFRDESGKEQHQDSSQQNKNSSLNNLVEDENKVQNDYYYNNNVNILA
ncbi:flagellar hook-length control protein FliK [Clostridium sp. BJN0013]|uniref:flagellar hook-length control protein FliK n=1 Tax=Clostridium sp. BJN0013 TaxID=3236840 RepID=UPI0034C6A5C1